MRFRALLEPDVQKDLSPFQEGISLVVRHHGGGSAGFQASLLFPICRDTEDMA